LFSIVFFIN